MRCIRTFTVQLTVVLLAWTGLASLVLAGSPTPRYQVVDLGSFAPLAISNRGELAAQLAISQGEVAARWTVHGFENRGVGGAAYDLLVDGRTVGETFPICDMPRCGMPKASRLT